LLYESPDSLTSDKKFRVMFWTKFYQKVILLFIVISRGGGGGRPRIGVGEKKLGWVFPFIKKKIKNPLGGGGGGGGEVGADRMVI